MAFLDDILALVGLRIGICLLVPNKSSCVFLGSSLFIILTVTPSNE